MRSILIALLSTAALVFSMKVADCMFDFPEDQTSYALCDRPAISNCLSAVPESNRLDFLEQCLLDGGCSETDAASITETIAGHCQISQNDGSWGDLKKRQKNNSKTSNKAQTTEVQTSAASSTTDAQSSATPSTTDSPSTAAATTTDTPSTQTTTASSTHASTTPSSTTSSLTTSSTTTSSSSSSTSGTALVCLTTSQSSITWCLTTTGANSATGTNCIPTFTPIISCAPGLICQIQPAGDTTCMVRQNNLTTSGLVVTIIFATIVFAFFASLLGMCIKSRRASRRLARQREAAMIAGAQAKNNQAAAQAAAKSSRRMENSSEAHLPLMAAQGPAGGDRDVNMGEYRDGGRPTAHRVPSGSYNDVVAARVPGGAGGISPAMMELDDDMGYRGPRGR